MDQVVQEVAAHTGTAYMADASLDKIPSDAMEWLENWPEEDVLWPDHPMEQHALSEDEKVELCLAKKECKEILKQWLSWAWLYPRHAHSMKKNRLITYLGGPPHETLDALYTCYLETHCSDDIHDVLGIVQEILQELKEIKDTLVKKETMALYAGESEEIKAKVKEYIHVQKQGHSKEKAELWSDEDQQRNLMKLATIANQFLKGLTDATGLSFSLLIGGPSVKLGGMIDVWSGFTHPTTHLPGNAEEPNSNRPDALPASSMAEDSTEDSRPSPILL
ncbi:uncharacterized protein BJ212DRAFT_1480607 [Suillus subaureus]|uniref:Uncharacterized protein n=1 Tax=Suillus subaureus TaxID=48587 RepID=A0A9P7EB74_9AGAM|nr:uncharacterized protein BJ212DRAFT_1480607 [Suillus subaureus]KAG1816748.1 hypothetical protein BJ212DRAFT_1480607 [Suillus subaureus]